jgi:hypothetical protein
VIEDQVELRSLRDGVPLGFAFSGGYGELAPFGSFESDGFVETLSGDDHVRVFEERLSS